jgi:GNAT superfamily N-acetyltransferase
MAATRAELAEDTAVYLLPRPTFETVDRGELVYVAGMRNATVHRVRSDDVVAALAWTREESRRRGLRMVEWWLGWSATPPGARAQLLELGLVPDEVPTLTGMTSSVAPPEVAGVEVQRVESAAEYAETIEIDWEVWQLSDEERAARRAVEFDRWEQVDRAGVVHLYAAFVDGVRVGFGRAIDMVGGVGLYGGAVLPEGRGRGAYRALVRARWEHAVERGTPLLVVQAGAMSAPVLTRLGFESHGEIDLLVDRLEPEDG